MEYRQPLLISSQSPYLRCCEIGYTAVVRISDLKEKFPGGPKRYSEKHCAHFSRDLSGGMAMHPDDLEEMLQDLYENGFKPGEEFYVVEGGMNLIFHKPGDVIDVGASWLVGLLTEDRFLVRLKEE